jgi:hypothetical protein
MADGQLSKVYHYYIDGGEAEDQRRFSKLLGLGGVTRRLLHQQMRTTTKAAKMTNAPTVPPIILGS